MPEPSASTPIASPPPDAGTPPLPVWQRRWGHAGEADPIPPGEVLSALRSGVGQEPGTAPQLWPYYTNLDEHGGVTATLRAEHTALVIFGFHQQGLRTAAHRSGVRLGRALSPLHRGEDPPADKIFYRMAASNDLASVEHHLRGLIARVKSLKEPVSLDYNRLHADLIAFQNPARRPAVRRHWAAGYFHHQPTSTPQEQS